MKYTKEHLVEAKRMLLRHFKVKGKHFRRLKGNDEEISEKIIEQLWTGKYYKTSLGHYPGFYARDFGMCIDSLLKLGKKKRVLQTLNYALSHYEKYGAIKTFINVKGKPVDFPNIYSPDSLAYMLRSVRVVKNKELRERFKPFLQREVYRFYNEAIQKITGEIKRKIHFGGMRDHSKRDSSCYDNVMAGVVSREADLLGLDNPLKRFNYEKILIEKFWTGEYFRDDQSSKTLSADANIYPFWLDIIKNKQKLVKTIISIKKENLDKPFPIKYVSKNKKKGKTIFAERLVEDWESDAIWPMSGLPYTDIVSRVDKKIARKHIDQYRRLIEHYGTFLEVYDRKGKPYHSKVYSCDEGMIWVANYLVMKRKLLK